MELESKFRIDAASARIAWEHVKEADSLTTDKKKKVYRSLVRSAGGDILTNGLGQTMAFYAKKGVAKRTVNKQEAQGLLFFHIVDLLRQRGLIGMNDNDNHFEKFFEHFTGDISFSRYRLMLAEVRSYISWSRRFAESILPSPTSGTEV